MNALNNQQVQNKKQSTSWVQEWLKASVKASERMATDEKFRQEVASRATNSGQDIQSILAKNIAKHNALKAQNLQR